MGFVPTPVGADEIKAPSEPGAGCRSAIIAAERRSAIIAAGWRSATIGAGSWSAIIAALLALPPS